jgi:ketosteroid isomerase-like protein
VFKVLKWKTQQKNKTMSTEKDNTSGETQIQQQINNFAKAFRAKDVNLMMSLFSAEMVSFDIIPPLQYAGSDAYRKVWQETFALFQDAIEIEIRDLHITTGENVAFSYCFLRLSATMVNGNKIDYWERLTCCFQKINDKWLIVHEHVSLPADLKTGKAVMNLKP